MNKYRSKKCECDGILFDSQKEAGRYLNLKLMIRAGEISNLELQPEFPIEINGQKVCKYKADFKYKTKDGKEIVEDVKGFKTAMYRLKKKLVKAVHGVEILET